ncbi:MAG: hypothetical protein J6Q53_08835 [Oscillospiraceae bacterium]|nr:hypothetical protein [Oscillospiraceae bacterium]
MKVKQRILAGMLALLLLCGLIGCAERPADPTGDTTMGAGSTEGSGSTGDSTVNPNAKVTCQYLPEKVENPENLPVLKWVCLTERGLGGGVRTWNEAAVQEVNQMLAEKKMPFRIQFVLLTMDQGMMYLDWFSYPEAQEALKDADLIYGAMTAEDMVQYLAPITEYVTGDAEPSLKNSVPHPLNWNAGTVGEEIYGIRTTITKASSSGWSVDADLLEQCDLTAADFEADFWEMDALFAKIYEANDRRPFLYIISDGFTTKNYPLGVEPPSIAPRVLNNMIPNIYDRIGSCFVVDYSGKTPVVRNVLDTEVTRKMQQALIRYSIAGYTTDRFEIGRIQYGALTGNLPYTTANDEEQLRVPVTTACYYEMQPYGHVSGVAAVSRHKQEAVQLLNLIAENEAFRMQLFYGKEGRDYKVEDGYYSLISHSDGSNYGMDFLSPLSHFCGLNSYWKTADLRSPGTENWTLIQYEGKTLLQTYREILDDSVVACPISFDYTGLEQELNAIQAVCKKYFPIFTTSQMTPDVYAQMLQEMKIAGSDKVVAQLQRQLETWQSANLEQ